MDIEWRGLSVIRGQKTILHPCSGYLRPGRMVALMGPSGSGKTTLLSCLRQDISHSGQVRFGGASFSQELRQLIGFVEQEDIVIPQLTVRESLRFLAELRFGINTAEAAARVEDVLSSLRLSTIADSKIGTPDSGARISGGERKRLCIARELLCDPQLLLCDEPTSGLDSTMAEQVVSAMRALCDSRQVSVLAAIHQPSTKIIQQFDDLILLRNGEVLYFGPVDKVESVFVANGPMRNPSQSTSEYVMDCLVLDQAATGKSALNVLELTARAQKQALALPELGAPVLLKLQQGRYAASFKTQAILLYRRHAKLLYGDIFTKVSAFQNIGLMLISAMLWVQLANSEANLHPRFGACMWTLGTWMFFPLFSSLGVFPACRQMLEKELKVGCYSLGAFHWARTFLTLPIDLFWPTVWTTGLFWITNLHPSFLVYLQVLCLVYLSFATYQGFGLAISASGMPGQHASTCALLLITYFFGWSGFFMDLSRVPSWIRWSSYGNVFMYNVQLMLHIVLPDELEIACDRTAQAADFTRVAVPCEQHGSQAAIVLSGARARERLGVDHNPWLCLAVILVGCVVSRILSFVLLRHGLRAAIDGVKGADLPANEQSMQVKGESEV